MATHLLIESQALLVWGRPQTPGAPVRAQECRCLRIARRLADACTETVVFLIDEGVTAVVGSRSEAARAVRAGVNVWVDEDSLVRRAIPPGDLAAGVVPAGLDKVAPLLFDPAVKVVWH